MFFVYILYSEKLDKYYVGYSNNYLERIERHNRGGIKFTTAGQPWSFVYKEGVETKELAAKREIEIKKWKSRKMIIKLIGTLE